MPHVYGKTQNINVQKTIRIVRSVADLNWINIDLGHGNMPPIDLASISWGNQVENYNEIVYMEMIFPTTIYITMQYNSKLMELTCTWLPNFQIKSQTHNLVLISFVI